MYMYSDDVVCTSCSSYRYTENWKKRAEIIAKNKKEQQTYNHYPKYPMKTDANVMDFCSKVSAEHSLFRTKKGIFGREWILQSAEKMPAYLWWHQHGGSVPHLQIVSRLVLSQPGSA
eukprot:CAMPEP_0184379154 /NCGR_PEP_ID=MMETSP0007-20130409/3597_1 /TAXON_ID=97485 /ORGANISM="Prymnesium parvum, Strain Texoma1" /LENGTH=116 /DNA_ID=CAMNT_0026723675 /DNA_START=354 /DNA_END=700 /DNA_ORIENTATION=+